MKKNKYKVICKVADGVNEEIYKYPLFLRDCKNEDEARIYAKNYIIDQGKLFAGIESIEKK